MKTNELDWMARLHKMRRDEEERRIREGLSVADWLRRVNAEADAAMAELPDREQPPVARDKPRTQ